jgi:Domain of Unknown Function (DUF1080)
MSLPEQGQTSQVCPRCKIILPINQIACYNCGFHFAAMQSGNASGNAYIPPSPGGRQPTSLGISKLRGGQPSSLGISQFKGGQPSSLGISQMRRGQPTSLGISQAGGETPALGVPQTRGGQPLLWREAQGGGETPALGVPQTRGGQPTPLGISQAGGETPALGVPQTRGIQVPTPAKAPASVSSGAPLAKKDKTEKDPSASQKRATFLYLATVVFVIVVVAFAGLHSAGISLTALTPHGATTPAVAYPLPKVVPLFADSFLNDVSGWNLQSSPGNYAVNVGNGTLTMAVDKNKLLWEPLPGTIAYGDFTLTINAVLSKGDQNNGYGLYIRGAAGQGSDLYTYYRFELYGDGSYAIFKGTVDQNGNSITTKIVTYTLSSAIQKQGKANHIMILANGAAMSFIVNGQLLKTFTDTSYAVGSIALFASNLPEAKPGIQVQFSQLALYPSHVSKPS